MSNVLSKSTGISVKIANLFEDFFTESTSYVINDKVGEDHIYIVKGNTPIFDAMVTSARKFVFVWYYNIPDERGIKMIDEMKNMVLNSSVYDFAVKYAGVQQKSTGFPSIIRYGKKEAGHQHEKFVLKHGNIFLEDKKNIYDDENKLTYRNYNWANKKILNKIYNKSNEMLRQRARLHPEYLINNIIGYYLYSGAAFSYLFPSLSFGLRDIDVEVLFDNKIKTNTRCAFTRNCEIDELGKPKYFDYKTRWLDLMYNNTHSDDVDPSSALTTFLNEMRNKSDRWSTMSQRPFINLVNDEVVFIPEWIKKLYISGEVKELFKDMKVKESLMIGE